jgi:opacity protein-like surface antigen
MRKPGLVLALLCMTIASPALALGTGQVTLGLGGGMGVPMGGVGDAFEAGFGGGVFADYAFSPMFSLGADVAYTQFKGKDLPAAIFVDSESRELLFAVSEARLAPTQFGLHLKAMPRMGSSLKPYVQVGAGLYSVNASTTTKSYWATFDTLAGKASRTGLKFGYNVGVGADLRVTQHYAVGLFGAFHSIIEAYETQTFDLANNVAFERKPAHYVTFGVRLAYSVASVPGK